MLRSALRWLIPLAALLLLGPVAGWLTFSLRAPDGGPDTTLLLCTSPIAGVLAGLGVFALAALAGCIAARMHGRGEGLFAAGLVLTWGAWGTGRVDQILRRTESGSTFWMIALEGALVGTLGVLTAAVIVAAARRPDVPRRHAGIGAPAARWGGTLGALTLGLARPSGPRAADDETHPAAALLALLFALAAGAAGAWLIAREPLKGQTFAAAAIAAILAGAIGHASAQRAPATLFVLAMGLLAVLGPLAAMVINFVPTSTGGAALTLLPSSAQVVAAARAGVLLPLARPLPLDWLAGAFIGIPCGMSWAAAMVDRPAHAEPA